MSQPDQLLVRPIPKSFAVVLRNKVLILVLRYLCRVGCSLWKGPQEARVLSSRLLSARGRLVTEPCADDLLHRALVAVGHHALDLRDGPVFERSFGEDIHPFPCGLRILQQPLMKHGNRRLLLCLAGLEGV